MSKKIDYTTAEHKLSFKEAVAEAFAWETTKNGYAALVKTANGNVAHHYLAKEIASCDKRLPAVFSCLAPWAGENIIGEDIRACLRYWSGDYIYLPKTALVVKSPPIYIDKLKKLKTCAEPGEALLTYTQYALQKTNNGTSYVREPNYTTVRIKTRWLDKNYPLWEEHLQVAQALDMAGEDYMEIVLPMKRKNATFEVRTAPVLINLPRAGFSDNFQ